MVDANAGAPQVSHVANWADSFRLEHPVLADTSRSQSRYASSYPTYVVIDREMVIRNNDMYPFDERYAMELF